MISNYISFRKFAGILFICNAMLAYPSTIQVTNTSELITAISSATAGDSIVLEAKTYTVDYVEGSKNTMNLTASGTETDSIFILCNEGQAVIDFAFPEQSWVQASYGFYLTGSYWHIEGIDITHAGYQGVYVEGAHNTFKRCNFYRNRNTGLEINNGGSYTTVINCDAYQNYDPKKYGSMADGFGPKQDQGPGNKFIGCRAWENSDDGYDCYDSPEIVTFENCWAIRNGVDIWNFGDFSGNGNGFKLGGNKAVANNQAIRCVAIGQPGKGFDQNNNAGGITLYNCTAYLNGTNYGMGNDLDTGEKHTFKNNISFKGSNSISNATQSHNTWNTGFSANADDFVNLDTSLATITRNEDGSIPVTSLLALDSTSSLIDAGIDVGLAFQSDAPDLGYLESPYTAIEEENSGFEEFELTELTLFPNPAKSIVNISFELCQAADVKISVFDFTGRLLTVPYTESVYSGKQIASLDIQSLPCGTYFVQIQINNMVVNRLKWIKY